jgi:signal peptidase I
MATADNHTRRPWIAVLLSLFCTGLGHVYCGRFVKGFVLYTISFFFMPLVAISALVGVNTPVLLFIAAGYGAVTAVYLYAIFDSHKVARQSDPSYVLRDYNSLVVYVLLVFLQVPFTVGIAFQFRAHVMEAFYCPARSMEPTIQAGDRILVNKTAYASRSPERGDIVVFASPENRRQCWIKRVIAIPGDTIAVRGDEVLLNGRPLGREEVGSREPSLSGFNPGSNVLWEQNGNARYFVQFGSGERQPGDAEETSVPPGKVFVLGDNRDLSRDSRNFGLIPQADVVGQVEFLYWPARTWSRFGAIR